MFCQNCGNQLAEGAAFCGQCGTKVAVQAAPQQPAYEAPQSAPQPAYEAPQSTPQPAYEAPQQPAYTAPQPSYQQPVQAAPVQKQTNADLDSMATNTMIFGIIGLATGVMAGVPGIILSIIAKNKAGEFEACAGSLYGKAKVGSILSRVGLPVSIALTAFYTLCFMIGFFSAL